MNLASIPMGDEQEAGTNVIAIETDADLTAFAERIASLPYWQGGPLPELHNCRVFDQVQNIIAIREKADYTIVEWRALQAEARAARDERKYELWATMLEAVGGDSKKIGPSNEARDSALATQVAKDPEWGYFDGVIAMTNDQIARWEIRRAAYDELIKLGRAYLYSQGGTN